MFRCGKSGKDLCLLQPLLLLFISSPLCVLATKRELRGFWRSEAGTLKREVLDVTPIAPLPHSMSVFTHCSPTRPPSFPPFVSLCLTSPLFPDVDSVFISPPGVLPFCLHPSLFIPPFFFFFYSASSQLLQYMCRSGTSFRHELTDGVYNPTPSGFTCHVMKS